MLEINPEIKIKLEAFKPPKDLKISSEEINEKIDEFLNDNSKELEFFTINEAKLYFHAIRDLYNNRMKEYINELNYISNKLEKYDEILTKKYMIYKPMKILVNK